MESGTRQPFFMGMKIRTVQPIHYLSLLFFPFLDLDECLSRLDNCAGNTCVNKVGTFSCSCREGMVDVSEDFKLLPGRSCIGLLIVFIDYTIDWLYVDINFYNY